MQGGRGCSLEICAHLEVWNWLCCICAELLLLVFSKIKGNEE